jgi:hypothetical protein
VTQSGPLPPTPVCILARALEALRTIGALQRSGEEIKYITSPQEGEIGVEMLRVLAKEEEEELQASA